MKVWPVLVVAVCVLQLITCTTGVTGGIGHEGEARVTGRVVFSDSAEVPTGAAVFINSTDFVTELPSSDKKRKPDAVVDEKGRYTLESVPSGEYLIEITDGGENAVCIPLEVSGNTPEVDLPPDTMRHTGTIRGKLVILSDSAASIFVQIYGMDRIAKVDERTDSFTIADMPEGSYTLRIVSGTGNVSPKDINSISVEPDRITSVGFVYQSTTKEKGYTNKVILNTTSNGVEIEKPVYGFPVLVRLNENNFDFTMVQSDGSDIRFISADGEKLPFEIERLDVDAGVGTFWVRVDTIHVDNDTQFFYLKWGAAPEGPSSNGYAVFDTVIGFQGVWHLGEAGQDTVKDATINGFHGVCYGMESEATFDGAIGNAHFFNGTATYIAMPTTADSRLNFSENGHFSVSAWVWVDTLDDQFHSVVSKSNQLYSLGIDDANNWEFFEFEDENAWVANLSPAQAGIWKHLYAVVRGEDQFLYINGICVDSTAEPIGETRYRVTTDPVTIGKRTTSTVDGWFAGMIDEVRIESVARSEDWIRLCFGNQCEDGMLVNIVD